jgi:hypothetical protein
MAKCSICNSRKGKRKCIVQDNYVCSICCGDTRSFDKCKGCSFYKDTTQVRNYKTVPYYPLSQMADTFELQDHANVIESAICQFDHERNGTLNDDTISRIVELLLNRYYFKDEELTFSGKLEENGLALINEAIREELSALSREELVKLLGAVYRSISRHNVGGRQYLDFIHEHVGLRIGKGIRLIGGYSRRGPEREP